MTAEQKLRVVTARVSAAVVIDLRARARRNGRTTSAEVRELLRQTLYGTADGR